MRRVTRSTQLKTANCLQESSEESSAEEARCDLDVGSSTGGRGLSTGGSSAGASGVSAGAGGPASTRSLAGASSLSARAGGRGGAGRAIHDGGGVGGGDNDLDGAVVANGDDNSVDARGLGGDRGTRGKRRDGSVSRRLGWDGGVGRGLGGCDRGSTGNDSQGVCLLEVGGLGSGIDGGRLIFVRRWDQVEIWLILRKQPQKRSPGREQQPRGRRQKRSRAC